MSVLPTEYGLLVRELQKRAAINRQPVSSVFELTSRCNLSCRMCYIRYSDSDTLQHKKELSAKDWLSIARQAVDHGMVFLLLTGGEIFLRPDFFEIYEPLTRMGIIITLFTNGTLITDVVAERLAQAPPSHIEITLYGASANTYEAVTGIPGSYARCCNGIEALINHDISLGLKTTITRYNIAELEAMRQIAHRWGTPFSSGWLLLKRRDGAPSEVENCRLSAIDCIALEGANNANAHDWTEVALHERAKDGDGNFLCYAGKAAFAVNSAGEMNPCPDLPYPAAGILEAGFAAAWMQVQEYVDGTPPPSPVCRACDARIYCERCPAWSLMETGTSTNPVPYLCEIARTRKECYERTNEYDEETTQFGQAKIKI